MITHFNLTGYFTTTRPLLFVLMGFSLMACTDREALKARIQEQSLSSPAPTLNAHLPLQFDSCDYLIHPLGVWKVEARPNTSSSSSGSYSSGGSPSLYSGANYLSGQIQNLKFQHQDSSQLRPLSSEELLIQKVEIIRKTSAPEAQALAYWMHDEDSNGDKKISIKDLASLYISQVDGRAFQKLSPIGQALMEYQWLPSAGRLYFSTREDLDQNQIFDEKDQMHYFYVNLDFSEVQVQEYYPLAQNP